MKTSHWFIFKIIDIFIGSHFSVVAVQSCLNWFQNTGAFYQYNLCWFWLFDDKYGVTYLIIILNIIFINFTYPWQNINFKNTESLKIAKKRYFHYRTKKQSIHFVKDAQWRTGTDSNRSPEWLNIFEDFYNVRFYTSDVTIVFVYF